MTEQISKLKLFLCWNAPIIIVYVTSAFSSHFSSNAHEFILTWSKIWSDLDDDQIDLNLENKSHQILPWHTERRFFFFDTSMSENPSVPALFHALHMSDWPQKKCKGAGNLRLYFIIAARIDARCLVLCRLCSMNNSKTM